MRFTIDTTSDELGVETLQGAADDMMKLFDRMDDLADAGERLFGLFLERAQALVNHYCDNPTGDDLCDLRRARRSNARLFSPVLAALPAADFGEFADHLRLLVCQFARCVEWEIVLRQVHRVRCR